METLSLIGFDLFAFGASAADIALLARKRPPPPHAQGLQVVPTLTMAHDEGHGRTPILGIAGTF